MIADSVREGTGSAGIVRLDFPGGGPAYQRSAVTVIRIGSDRAVKQLVKLAMKRGRERCRQNWQRWQAGTVEQGELHGGPRFISSHLAKLVSRRCINSCISW